MSFLEFLWEVLEAVASWRLIVCVGPALAAAYFLHRAAPGASWPWLVSIPLVAVALVVGVRWEWSQRES